MGKLANKKTFIALTIVILAVILITLNQRDVDKNWSNSLNRTILASSDPQSPRYLAIKNLIESNLELVRKDSITTDNPERLFFAVTYNYATKFFNHLDELDISKKQRGGVIVFSLVDNHVKKTWESQEIIQGASSPGVRFFDLNNDKVKEMIVSVPQSNIYESLYVYKFENNMFKLISPLIEEKYTKVMIPEIYGTMPINVSDIDDDGITEIITRELIMSEDHKGATDPQEIVSKTYKFNGQVYALWREEKLTQ